jgi:ribosomal protein L31
MKYEEKPVTVTCRHCGKEFGCKSANEKEALSKCKHCRAVGYNKIVKH